MLYNWYKWVKKCNCLYCKIKNQNFVEVYYFIIFTPDLPVGNKNCEESSTEKISAESLENNQFTNTTPMKNSAMLKEGIYSIFMIFPFFYHKLRDPSYFYSSFLLPNLTFMLFLQNFNIVLLL